MLLLLAPPPAPVVALLLTAALAVLPAVDVAPPLPPVLLALVVDLSPPVPEAAPVPRVVASVPPQPAWSPAKPSEARKPIVAAREAVPVKDRSMLASIPQASFVVLGSAP